jgi:hypothetical protein
MRPEEGANHADLFAQTELPFDEAVATANALAQADKVLVKENPTWQLTDPVTLKENAEREAAHRARYSPAPSNDDPYGDDFDWSTYNT